MSDLPDGWAACRLGDVIRVQNGYAFPSKDFRIDGVPLIRQSNLAGDRISLDKCVYLEAKYLELKPEFILRKGDVLIGMSGSLGKLCVCDLDQPVLQNQRTGKIIPRSPDLLSWRFMFAFLRTIEVQLLEKGKGLGVQNVSASDIESLPFRLPPFSEQHRIVATLEELLGKLDACQNRLAKISVVLKRFRQSVLAAACSGRLTGDWREASNSGHACTTLEGGESTGYEDSDSSADLPESWLTTHLDELCVKITDGEHLTPPSSVSGTPLLSAKDVRDGVLDFSETKFVSDEVAAKSRLRCDPENGDILVVSRGATVGRTCRVQTDQVFCLMGSVLLFKLDKSVIIPHLVEYCFKSPKGLAALIARSGATAQQAIYIRDMRSFPIPLPPLDEQKEIVRRVEALLILADQIEARYRRAERQVDKLTQSILAKAFRGELVPTEAEMARREGHDYESASALLERIRKEHGESTVRSSRAGARSSRSKDRN